MSQSLQFHFRRKTYLFKPGWGFSLLCLLLFCLCIALGVWQLHRYEYKQVLLATWQKRLNATPVSFKKIINTDDLAFQAVKIRGQYINTFTVLIQNHFYHDEPGYEVLTPIQIPNDKKMVWIDRGWIKQPENKSLPVILPVTKKQEISGHIKLLDEYQFILGDNILQPDSKPIVAQRMDVNELSRITHQTFYPFVVRLNNNEPDGFVRDWTIVTVTPARHFMYAMQWFAFALILLIGYFCFCCEEKDKYAKN